MSIMTEDQVKLLHKLQMAEILAFKSINPLTLQEDEARDPHESAAFGVDQCDCAK